MVALPVTLSAPSFVTGEPRDVKFGTLTYHSKSHLVDEKYSLEHWNI